MIKLFKEKIAKPLITSLWNEQEPVYDEIYVSGSRTGGKTYMIGELTSLLLNFFTKSNKLLKVDVYNFRSSKDMAKESYTEFCKNWRSKSDIISNNKVEKTLTTASGNEVRFLGANILSLINSNSANSGLSMRDDRELIFVFVEEAQQIDLVQLKNAFISIRSNKDTKFVYFFVMNPTNSSHPSVKKAIEICRPSINTLQRLGWIANTRSYDAWVGNLKITTKCLCIWNNFLTCKDDEGKWLIAKSKLAELMTLCRENPAKAICDVWGYPYAIGGFVYKKVADAVIKPRISRYERLTAGIDLAGGVSKFSAINTLVIIGWLDDNHGEIIKAVGFDQRVETDATIGDKAKFFLNEVNGFLDEYDKFNDDELEIEVRVDFGGGIGGDMIREVEKWNINDRITFIPCSKSTELEERITIEIDSFAKKRLVIFDTCEALIEQLENIEYVKHKTKNKMVRSDLHNDFIDAMEYAMCFEWKLLQQI